MSEPLVGKDSAYRVAIAAGDEGTKLAFASKEGPGSGPAAELEIEALLQPGSNNTVAAGSSVIGGGEENEIDPAAEWSVIPGGLQNEIGPAADYAFAAGRRAHALHTGSFVIADSTNADFTSTDDNQLSIRMANGLFIANDAGNTKVVPVGTRYRDNAIVAWARITAVGTLDTDFNVASVTKVGTGVYRIFLSTSLLSGFHLMPAVTPEVDPAVLPDTPPVGDANLRIAAVNLVAAGNTFDVYMYNGVGTLVDNDFSFIVTGR
jgi:hypothetical protein